MISRSDPGSIRSNLFPKFLSIFFIVCIFVGTMARFYVAASHPLGSDEIWGSKIFLMDYWTTFFMCFHPDHMPLFYWFMKFWIDLFGDGEFVFRIPSLLASFVCVGLIYSISKHYFGQKTAYFSSLLLILSPVHIFYSAEARYYSIGMMTVLLQVYFYIRLVNPQIYRHKLYYAIAYTLVFFISSMLYPYLLCFSAGVMLAVFFDRGKERMQVVYLTLGAVYVVMAYMIFRNFIMPFPYTLYYLRGFNLAEWWELWFNWYSFGNVFTPIGHVDFKATWMMILSRPILFSAQLVYAILFMVGLRKIITLPHSRCDKAQIVLWVFIFPLAYFLIALLFMKKAYIERAAVFGLPFFLILISFGITSIRQTLIRKTLYLFVLVFSFLSLFLFFAREQQWTVSKAKPDYRLCAEYLKAEQKKFSVPIVLVAEWFVLELTYYANDFDDPLRKVSLYRSSNSLLSWLRCNLGTEHPWSILVGERIQKGFDLELQNIKPIVIVGHSPKFDESPHLYFLRDNSCKMTNTRILTDIKAHPGIKFVDSVQFGDIKIYKFYNTSLDKRN